MTKFIFVTGGVVSSLGKGIVAASLGRLLKLRAYKISIQKLDPYLNVDPGTMSPYQHGEVFVTDDGAETDLDLGHYERFIDENLRSSNSMSSGRIYMNVLEKERSGEYLGGTVQMVPHVTDEIKGNILKAAKNTGADILIVEVGGTVGDIESSIFMEAIRQFRNDVGKKHVAYVHCTLVPNIHVSNELKTKPTQHSVQELRSKGIQPNVLVLRADRDVPADMRKKLSLFTDVPLENIIQSKDCRSIYEVPAMLEEQDFAMRVLEELNLEDKGGDLTEWQQTVAKITKPSEKYISVAVVGKYVELGDAYISVTESLRHACAKLGFGFEPAMILSDDLTDLKSTTEKLKEYDAICIPGGFGDRGVEGKLLAIEYARLNKVPLLGLCLGLQCVTMEFARNVLGLKDANSLEFDELTKNPVIHLMQDQKNITDKGGTMRLGSYPCKLKLDSKAEQAYLASDSIDNQGLIFERHRHRYEFNNGYREQIEAKGLIVSGTSPDDKLVEIVELIDHPYYLACQFHPEFKTRPNRPHPLFVGLIKAASEIKFAG